MKPILLIISSLFFIISVNAQITQLASMPEPVSNNAVVGATVGGIPHAYSFSGIDSTKMWSGIHKKAFRYNTFFKEWDSIAPLPSGTGRIAAGASNVKNKIYIIGGYEVFPDGNERSLDEVHIYDPETNTYLPDGQPVPIPIDDHVQAVWKDSLIFVVTGWSQNTNVRDVQIYNPAADKWLVGSPVPNTSTYKVFGGSGAILGDTLYYIGGARAVNNFPASTFLRKGYINPNDPTDITWSAELNLNSVVYRSGCVSDDFENIRCFGGSAVTYNFDGIAYNGTGGVEPTGEELFYHGGALAKDDWQREFPKIMDLRGVAKIEDSSFGNYIIAGGMEENQKVTDKAFSIEYLVLPTDDLPEESIKIFPNPTTDAIQIDFKEKFNVTLFNIFGRKLMNEQFVNIASISLKNFPTGIYFAKIENESGFEKIEKIIKANSF